MTGVTTRRFAIFAALLTACGPGFAETGDGSDETGDGDPVGWAELACIDVNGPVAMARPEGASDAWVYVLHVDELDARVQAGGLVGPVDAWGNGSCAAGASPSTMLAEHRCYLQPLNGLSACFAGDGEWFAAVVPACDPDLAGLDVTATAWAGWTCGAEADVNPWDEIACTAEELGCFAWSGNAAALVRPACWVSSYARLPIDACI